MMTTHTVPTLDFKRGQRGVLMQLDQLITSRLLVQANSGGGKSHALRYLLEQTHGRVQQIVLDREGEFSTLAERFPYLLVGREGYPAADVRTAKLLARKVMELNVSAVIDMSELSLRAQREYVRAFVETINHLPRTLWRDCLIVIDEAHLFAPETGKGDPLALEAIATLLSTGRKRGYCAVLATQRVSKLSKDVSAECLNKLIGRTSQEDLKRAGDELGLSAGDARELRALSPGSFWAYGPAVSTAPVLVTSGDVQTAPPSRGAARAVAPAAPAAIKKVLAELHDLPAQVDAAETEVETLRARVRELAAQITNGKPAVQVVDETAVAKAVQQDRHATALVLRSLDRGLDAVEREVTALGEHVTSTRKVVGALLSEVETRGAPAIPRLNIVEGSWAPEKRERLKQLGDSVVRPTFGQPPKHVVVRVESTNGTGLSGPGQRILNAMRFLRSMGVEQPNAATIAGLVGVSPKTGTWANRMSELRQAGMIEDVARGVFALSPAGLRQASTDGLPRTLAELHDTWFGKLSGPAAKVLRILLAAYPHGVSKADIARELDVSPTTGTFANRLSELRSPGLLVDVDRSTVRAADMLVPPGLR